LGARTTDSGLWARASQAAAAGARARRRARPCRRPGRSALPNQRPIVNVVAVFLVLLSLLPLYLAQRLTRDASTTGGRT